MEKEQHIERFKQYRTQANARVDHQIANWNSVKHKYLTLGDRLKTLPDKPHYDVMVPFGKLAFKPGKLIHTNELLVLLGDKFFAEVTCKQGLKIVDHRVTAVQKNLDDLDKVKKNLTSEAQHLNQLSSEDQNKNLVEIKEKEEGVFESRKDKKRISHYKGKEKKLASYGLLKNKPNPVVKDIKFKDDEELLKYLEKAEEDEEREENAENKKLDKLTTSVQKIQSEKAKKSVSWNLPKQIDSDDSDDSVNQSDCLDCDTGPPVIRFKHSSVIGQKKPFNDSDEISTPADICKPGLILKKPNKEIEKRNKQWVTQDVMEKGFEPNQVDCYKQVSNQTKKKVSKFKMSKIQK